ncbi:hypothetical protein A248_27507, partial [Pseudomonas syringae pv. actinidiae ICMP 19100]
ELLARDASVNQILIFCQVGFVARIRLDSVNGQSKQVIFSTRRSLITCHTLLRCSHLLLNVGIYALVASMSYTQAVRTAVRANQGLRHSGLR